MDVLLSDSDCESFTESSSSEEQDDIESMFGGHAQSILSNLEDTIGKIDDFLLFERGFMHGDVVCSVTDPSRQKGRVIGVDMFVDLESVNGKKIRDINSKQLLKVRSFSVGDYVIHGPWLGRVDKVVDRLTIVFDDGAKCEITPTNEEMIIPISPDLLEDSQYPFYPGQRVQIRRSTVSNSARWLCGTWKENRDEGTVCSVDAGFVYVDWIASAPVGQNSRFPAPRRVQETRNLTLLSCFSHENWQLGDWCILKRGSNYDEIFAIVKTRTKVDVMWQNGNFSSGLDSHGLFPAGIVDAHEFWPEQCVLEKGSCDDPNVSSTQRIGVVTGVDAEERTVKVKWTSIGVSEECDSEEEIVSAYELVEHPDYSFCLGDVVLRVEKEGSLDLKCYLSCIGYVKGFKDGNIEVIWATGLSTEIAPYDIVQIDKVEGSTGNPELDEGNGEEVNREMTECDKQSSDKEGKEMDLNGVGEECNKYLCESTSFFLPRAAIGFFTSIASSLFGAIGSTSLSSGLNISIHENQTGVLEEIEVTKYCKVCSEEPSMEIELEQQDNAVKDKIEISHSEGREKPEQFSKFDIVVDCSDHHFVDGAGKGLMLQPRAGWSKIVQQEWSILQKDLPETIYVRIYEERMDLLRAIIVGAQGTPYHDGLFFFDIFLPPEYPHEPPVVHYNSGGLRVNPNLYESGKVCLSLLNTWAGTGTEVWNPGSSTILQVLLSLQALVLNEKPYFNEAGYDRQMGRAEGEKNSVSYNENAFLMTCKSMLYVLRKPPKHFETFVDEHFNARAQNILSACKKYMEAAPVGSAFGCRETEQEKGSSTGFKIMLSKLFPKLVEAFSGKGIDCSEFTGPEKESTAI